MRIYRELSRQTGGTYNVILDDVHLKDLLHAQLEPPPSTLGTEPTLIKMGFPCHTGFATISILILLLTLTILQEIDFIR